MANFTLGANVRSLIQQFPESISGLDRGVIICSSIARAIAQSLPLPTSPVGEFHSHYTLTHGNTVSTLVSEFNETLVIDTRMVMDLTFKFYKLRYDVCHGTDDVVNTLSVIAMCSPDNFPPKVNDILKRENPTGDKAPEYYRQWNYLLQAAVSEIRERDRAYGVPTPVLTV